MTRAIPVLGLSLLFFIPTALPAQKEPGKKPAKGWGEPERIKKEKEKKGLPKVPAAKKPAQEKPAPKQGQVNDRLRTNRSRLAKDRITATNILVEVVLKNRQKLTGIVRNDRFVEKQVKGEYKKAEKDEPGAGVRLYYYNNTSSMMFLRYSSIAAIRKMDRLSDLEVKAKAERIRKKEEDLAHKAKARARERIEKIKARQKQDEKLEKNLKKVLTNLEKQKEEMEQQIRRAKLLDEFPPDQGWGTQRIERIRLNKINGIYPTKKEARFLEVFEEWSKACRERSAAVGGKPPEEKGKK